MNFLIVGGSGYIGRNLARRLKSSFPNCRVISADIVQAENPYADEFVRWDVRESAPQSLAKVSYDWIFNFAAIHREPGHNYEEYFDTNIPGANNVVKLAETSCSQRIFFTSSIAVYGPTLGPTSEETRKYPRTAYGFSKLAAELIHQKWMTAGASRRLVVCRPGVIYGAGETGNIPRMVKAIKKGIFMLPGSADILKSYGYIEGLMDSILFTTAIDNSEHCSENGLLEYNYVEAPTEPLGKLVADIGIQLGLRPKLLKIPLWLLVPIAYIVQFLTGGRSGIHPLRVKKAATSTHIIPGTLSKLGFTFRYSFADSLKDWHKKAPQDF